MVHSRQHETRCIANRQLTERSAPLPDARLAILWPCRTIWMSIIRSGSFPESVMLRHLKRLAHRQAERTQFGQRVLGIAMMHERPTGFFPEMPVLERVINEDVASLGKIGRAHVRTPVTNAHLV